MQDGMDEDRGSAARHLAPEETELVERARQVAHTLYEGTSVPHRSCGIAIAETFGLRSTSYQALRRGGITGEGECGAIKAGELVLGELLGDPDPTGTVTATLREGAVLYRELWSARVELGPGGRGAEGQTTIVCNDLTRPHGDFRGVARHQFCTSIAAEVAAVVCEVALRCGGAVTVYPVAEEGGPKREPTGEAP